MDFKLELVVVPVSDVDRAKAFYTERAGFELHVDHRAGDSFRVVQLNPPGSACSIAVGTGITDAAPGSVRGLHLVVSDIVAAREELLSRGVEVGELRHMGEAGWSTGAHPERSDYATFASFADPDGNTWLLQEHGYS
jgi:catechol 2,3-dioxygenase-like lactoylglutathione lyase family enzyme